MNVRGLLQVYQMVLIHLSVSMHLSAVPRAHVILYSHFFCKMVCGEDVESGASLALTPLPPSKQLGKNKAVAVPASCLKKSEHRSWRIKKLSLPFLVTPRRMHERRVGQIVGATGQGACWQMSNGRLWVLAHQLFYFPHLNQRVLLDLWLDGL